MTSVFGLDDECVFRIYKIFQNTPLIGLCVLLFPDNKPILGIRFPFGRNYLRMVRESMSHLDS